MPLDARRLIAFSDAMNDQWWPALRKMEPPVLAKKVDYSFLTPLGILTHIANIEHAWMDVVEGKPPQWARYSTKTWEELSPVEAYARDARARTHALVDDLDDEDLTRPCPVDPSIFARDAFTVEELLFTVFSHEQWHRGELMAALWSQDVAPPTVDWPKYGSAITR